MSSAAIFCGSSVAKMARVRNNAIAQDLVIPLRGRFARLEKESYMHQDLECVISTYVDFLLEVLMKTPRPTQTLFSDAAREAYDRCSPAEAEAFGRQLAACVKYCRDKVKSFVTGAKLHPDVVKIVLLLKKYRDERSPASSSKTAAALPVQEESQSQPQTPKPISKSELLKFLGVSPLQEQGSGQHCKAPLSPWSISDQSNSPPKKQKKAPVSQASSSTGPAAAPGNKAYFDNAKCCLVRSIGSGQVQEATMEKGPRGLLLAYWPDDPNPVETEVPNLILDVKEANEQLQYPDEAVVAKSKAKAEKAQAKAEAKAEKASAKASGKAKSKAKAKTKAKAKAKASGKQEAKGKAIDEDSHEDEDSEAHDDDDDDDDDGAQDDHEAAAAAPKAEAEPAEPAIEALGLDQTKFDTKDLKMTNGSKQSYICGMMKGKKVLLVAVSMVQTEAHQSVMQKILTHLQKKSTCTKADAISKRGMTFQH